MTKLANLSSRFYSVLAESYGANPTDLLYSVGDKLFFVALLIAIYFDIYFFNFNYKAKPDNVDGYFVTSSYF